ncbi:MAG: hypothetical protein QOI86_4257, partial [Actinomycetota bacterium]|nr:hypothetical protein [Actinomycetota bacterium]
MNSNHSRSSPRGHWKPIFGVALVATLALGLPAPAPAASLPGSTGAPIVVIAADGFGRYLGDILEAEGLNEYQVVDHSAVSADMLRTHKTALLGPDALSAAEVTTLSNWVTAGGNLIAMKPDKQLAGLLGLSSTAGTLSDSYLKVDTGSSPGAGIVADTMQFHGTADKYNLAGARQVAALYSNATTATVNPAVTVKDVGTAGGQAAAFTYDLAKSVIYTRQGNPAWVGQERDGCSGGGVCPGTAAAPGDNVIRSDELFWGAAPQAPQPGGLDISKVAIPQADEQQRLLANLVTSITLDQAPLPRFSYLPRGLQAAVVMTGDDHANGGTAGRFQTQESLSPANCSVANWECIRSTSYIYPGAPPLTSPPGLTDAQAAAYTAAGFEIALHVNTGCANYTVSSLTANMADQAAALAAQLPSMPPLVTSRTHCIPWNDWAGTPTVEAARGIGLDTTYYYWPPALAASNPGMFTGSGFPMRYANTDGSSIDVYQAVTQMTDESGQNYPSTINALLDKAQGPQGFYGVFTANMHTDSATSAGADSIIASAKAHNVPVISAKQLLTWIDGRNSSSFGNVAWSNNDLTFNLTAGAGSNGLQALVPMRSTLGPLTNLTKNGGSVSYTTQTIKGVQYAAFAAAGGAWRATYRDDTPPPPTTTTTAPPVVLGASARSGYWMVGTDGKVYPFGDAKDLGNPSASLGGVSAMDVEPTPSLNGYWVVDSAGRVFAYGDAAPHGNANPASLAKGETITSLSRT